MLEMKMLSLLPSEQLDGAVEMLNQLKWNISISKQGDIWLVFGGEKCLLKSSCKDAAEAFVYGLALAYGVLPDSVLEHVRRHVNEVAR